MDFNGLIRQIWPVAVLLLGPAAVMVALVSESRSTTAAAAVFVLSAVQLAALHRRAARGNTASGTVWRTLVTVFVLTGVALLCLADQAAVAFALLAVAFSLTVLVSLLAVVFGFVTAIIRPPWMLDGDGQLLGFPGRVRSAARRWQEHPGRSPERIYQQILSATTATTWRAPSGRRVAFSHLHVTLHPDTLRILDEWMPIEDLASDLANAYAGARDGGRRKSALVVVLLSSDPGVPVGVGSVHGSFREDVSTAHHARAWAKLSGPMEGRGNGEARRRVPISTTAARRGGALPESWHLDVDPTLPLLLEAGDRTRIQPVSTTMDCDPVRMSTVTEDAPTWADAQVGRSTRTATLTRTVSQRTVLVLRRCLPDGQELRKAPEHLLDPSRPWTVGRAKWVDVRFDEPHVSREHLHLIPRDGGWTVVDRSTLGTTVNGRELEKNNPAPIEAGDILELGSPREGGQRLLLLVIGSDKTVSTVSGD